MSPDRMKVAPPLRACSSRTNKKLNRDAYCIIENTALQITGIAVADGIGNAERVEEASKMVVEFFQTEISNLKALEDLKLKSIFEKCKIAFNNKFKQQINDDQFGTTLIIALEYPYDNERKIKIAYVGNGAVWHIKGNFNHFDDNQLFAWNSLNLLIPHSIQQSGREALANCISLEPVETFKGPSLLEFNIDKEAGDIVMICTDGIYSYDQLNAVIDGTGKLWLQFGESMQYFFRHLKKYFQEKDYTDISLLGMLTDYLQELHDNRLIDDDATIGLIVLPEVLDHQQKIFNEPVYQNI